MSGITKTILIFGFIALAILLLFQLEKWSLYTMGGSERIYSVMSGVLFLALGIFIGKYVILKIENRKRALKKSSLTKQELRVLNLIAEGKSNREIAEQLFIAETTIKTHVSNILAKLDANRRTEAVKIGRELRII